MRTRILSELRRSEAQLGTQVTDAINTAIDQIEAERFYFNETREITFDTVVGQEFYTATDNVLIGRITKFDYVKLIRTGSTYSIDPERPERIETLNNNGTQTGEPRLYCYYGEKLRIYPVPASIESIRIGAQVKVPAPADNVEADNPWMVKAEKLVRCYAKYELYENVLFDPIKAPTFNPNNEAGPTAEAFRNLRKRTNALTQQGGWIVRPTCF